MARTSDSPDPENGFSPGLPWRGPGGRRPDLPLPPAHMPLFSRGLLRKRWRYVGYYGERVMLCLALVEIGFFRHSFWSFWERRSGEVLEHTRLRPDLPEVSMAGNRLELRADAVTATLELGDSRPVEAVCPSGRGWGWTRKRAGIPVVGRIEVRDRVFTLDGLGVDDESAGYQQRHTDWGWSAGVGTDIEGRAVAWNLVSGMNDPPVNSERAIWVDGVPTEPDPVVFEDLEAISFRDGGRLDFDFKDGAERCRDDNFGLIRSRYLHRFGTFSGSLDGIGLKSAAGVMEHHTAVW